MPPASAYGFLAGLACGAALLATTSYRRVSPPWLKWLLIVTGLFTMSRYVAMALFTTPEASSRFWAWRHVWFASAIGLTLPSVFAVDQLLRHPAMTPKKLLRLIAPFAAVYGAVTVFGRFTPEADPLVGWVPRLSLGWRWVVGITQGVFTIGLLSTCALLIRNVPLRPTRLALLGLAAGFVYLGIDGLILAFGGWYARPFLYSEILTLLALWHAYDTAFTLQQTANT